MKMESVCLLWIVTKACFIFYKTNVNCMLHSARFFNTTINHSAFRFIGVRVHPRAEQKSKCKISAKSKIREFGTVTVTARLPLLELRNSDLPMFNNFWNIFTEKFPFEVICTEFLCQFVPFPSEGLFEEKGMGRSEEPNDESILMMPLLVCRGHPLQPLNWTSVTIRGLGHGAQKSPTSSSRRG